MIIEGKGTKTPTRQISLHLLISSYSSLLLNGLHQLVNGLHHSENVLLCLDVLSVGISYCPMLPIKGM